MVRRTQQDRTAETKAALVASAAELFAESGYHDVSLDAIVRRAGVTRGAMYHHYADKKDLFRAVFEELEAEMAGELADLMARAATPVEGLERVLDAYLDFCQRPERRRICLIDAPAVLGWQAWKQLEARHGVGLVAEWLQALSDGGLSLPAPADVLAPLLVSTAAEVGLTIATAPDPGAARRTLEPVVRALLAGLLAPRPNAANA